MQSHPAEPASGEVLAPAHVSYDPYVDSGLGAVFKDTYEFLVGQVQVVDQQFSLGAFDESEQPLPRVGRAYNQFVAPGLVWLAFGVTFKEPRCFLHQFAVPGYDSEGEASIP